MGREVRRVPADWQHPTMKTGNYIPLYGSSFSERLKDWEEGNAKWNEGLRKDWSTGEWKPVEAEYRDQSFADWDGDRPKAEDYMPDWPVEERTHYQMYEDTTEGTPISPVMASPEQLARWLVDNNASAFAVMTASYEAWLRVFNGGYAVSAVMTNGKLESGVEGLTEESDKNRDSWHDVING
jgi:putative sterol carrier protein